MTRDQSNRPITVALRSVAGQDARLSARRRLRGRAMQADGTLAAAGVARDAFDRAAASATLCIYQLQVEDADSARLRVVGRTPLCDPRQRIAFAIENHFSAQRFLTPADFDIVATHRSADGTWWLLDALGPLLLHADPQGAIIEAPRPLPDPRQVDQPICLRHHPSTEEGSVLRVMNALRAHAIARGANCRLVISPDHQL